MAVSSKRLVETDVRSPQAQLWTVRADTADARDWLRDAAVCPLLKPYQIQHLGVALMPAPFDIVRTKLGGSYFLASLAGEGRVLVDGRWQRVLPGQAFLLPPGTLQAFHVSGSHWDHCWIRYLEAPGQKPLATGSSPVLAKFDNATLQHAIQGLYHECTRAATPALVDHWVQLIAGYVKQFAEPAGLDERIWHLWEAVEADLARPWMSCDLARVVHLSEKQLERLCRRELGRTPRQQLIWLRMRRAAELLQTTDSKIEAIAREVGYQNPFVFSTTFKRCLGWSPSEYPGRR